MDKAYDFQAKNRNRELVNGVVYAEDADTAYVKLTKMSYSPSTVPTLNLSYTIRNFLSRDFDKKELARFYKSMSKRLKQGRSVPEGLDQAVEFIDDPKLKQALIMMRQFVLEGNTLASAMNMAGFPTRDVEVIRSTAVAGKQSESMERISQEILRAHILRKSISSVLRIPIAILFIMYSAFYGIIVFIAPGISKFFKESLNNVKLPAFAEIFYNFAAVFKQNLVFSTTIYISVLIGLVLFVKSSIFKRLIDKIKLVKTISERTDMSNLWTSFSMLYDAGINTEETCQMLSNAALREDSRECFVNMRRYLRSGLKIPLAVEKSGFPDYIKKGVMAAESSGDLVGGLEDLADDLATDVEEYTAKLKDSIQLVSVAILSAFILLFFMVSYYPIVSATLSQI